MDLLNCLKQCIDIVSMELLVCMIQCIDISKAVNSSNSMEF